MIDTFVPPGDLLQKRNDTALISSSQAMVKHLDAAKQEEQKGKGSIVRLDDI